MKRILIHILAFPFLMVFTVQPLSAGEDYVSYTFSIINKTEALLLFEKLQEPASFKVSDKRGRIVFLEHISEVGIVKRKYNFAKLPEGYYPYALQLGNQQVDGGIEVFEDSISILEKGKRNLLRERLKCDVINGELQVHLYSDKGNWVEIEVRRMGGKQVLLRLYEKPEGKFSKQVDLSEFERGKYLIKARVEGKYFVQSFEVE